MDCDTDWKAVPGVEPFDVELLRQLPSRQLLDAAWHFTKSLHWNHWFLAHPMACQSMSDLRDVDVAAWQMGDVESLLGERLLDGYLGGLTAGDREWLTMTAGASLSEEYHAGLMREWREAVDLWLRRAWEALGEPGPIGGGDSHPSDPEHPELRRHQERPAEPPAAEPVDPGEPHDADSLRGRTAAELLTAVVQSPDESPERLTGLGAILGEKLLAGAFPDLQGERVRAVAWRVGRAVIPVYREVKLPLAVDAAL